MKDHFLTFMDKMFRSGHAEAAPPLKVEEEHWSLLLFGVYRPRKPKQIWVVFDFSAQYNGVQWCAWVHSATCCWLNNTLLIVLMRFRKKAIALTADVEQMFYCFSVREDDRNF